MKIRIEMTVEVDPQAWELTYGIPADDTKQLRADVKSYLLWQVHGSAAANEGAITKAVLR